MDIVVGYLRSPEGEAALERAVGEAELRSGRLLIVHSMEGGARQSADEVISSRDELNAVAARLHAEGIEHQIIELVRGNSPADDLLQVADEFNADLIVIGLRRRTLVGKMLLGSNAELVLLGANCPVTAVKAEAP